MTEGLFRGAGTQCAPLRVQPKGLLQPLYGPLRLAAGAAIHLPLKGRQDGWCRRHRWSRARAGFFAALRSAQNDKIIVILRSAATKDLALARFHITGAPPSGVAASPSVVRAKRTGRACNARPYGVAPTPFHAATADGRHPQSGTTPLRAKLVLCQDLVQVKMRN